MVPNEFNTEIWELAEAYLDGSLSFEKLQELKNRLNQDKDFYKEFNETISFLKTIQSAHKQSVFKKNLSDIVNENKNIASISKKRTLKLPYWRTAAVAASAALLASVATQLFNNYKHTEISKYSELRKVRTEIQDIKESQYRIIKDLNTKANKPLVENTYSGTGFAITNNGYVVTNYHVTNGADSIYIETSDGDFYKASLISFDETNDIALLKVDSKKFKFSKQEQLPFTLASTKSDIGESVYTIGYPQDEIVYKEGYISSKNGYEGNTKQYQLEMTLEPGQSGSPIINSNGEVIGIISGKSSNIVGKSYAISSDVLLKLLKNIPQSKEITISKTNKLTNLSRKNQIKKMQAYTCIVNIYK